MNHLVRCRHRVGVVGIMRRHTTETKGVKHGRGSEWDSSRSVPFHGIGVDGRAKTVCGLMESELT